MVFFKKVFLSIKPKPCPISLVNVFQSSRVTADVFEKSVLTMNEHSRNIYEEKESDLKATIRKFRIVQMEGARSVNGLFATIWKFQIVRCAMINRLLIGPAPDKRLYSGNCGYSVPTIFFVQKNPRNYRAIRATPGVNISYVVSSFRYVGSSGYYVGSFATM